MRNFTALLIVNFAMVQILVCVVTLAYAFGAHSWIDYAYTHRLSTEDATDIIVGSYTLYFAVVHIYGFIALLPVILFIGLFLWALGVCITGGIFFVVQEFLRLEIERNEWSRPFAALATAASMSLCLFMTVGFLLSRLGPVDGYNAFERWLDLNVSILGMRLESKCNFQDVARDKAYELYSFECEAALAAAEFIGPSPKAFERFQKAVHKIWPGWPMPKKRAS